MPHLPMRPYQSIPSVSPPPRARAPTEDIKRAIATSTRTHRTCCRCAWLTEVRRTMRGLAAPAGCALLCVWLPVVGWSVGVSQCMPADCVQEGYSSLPSDRTASDRGSSKPSASALLRQGRYAAMIGRGRESNHAIDRLGCWIGWEAIQSNRITLNRACKCFVALVAGLRCASLALTLAGPKFGSGSYIFLEMLPPKVPRASKCKKDKEAMNRTYCWRSLHPQTFDAWPPQDEAGKK